jgi:signal transduction histidine kinase
VEAVQTHASAEVAPHQRAHRVQPQQREGWVASRDAAARLIDARDAREALTAAADLCWSQLGSVAVGILLERQGPWLVSRGVPGSVSASLLRAATFAAALDGGMSAVEIGGRVAAELTPIPTQVVSVGRAALVVGISGDESEERLLARVAASVQDVVGAAPPDGADRSEASDHRVGDGLAWTAHEFRAPLGAVRAVLDRLVESGSSAPGHPVLLRRARDEVVLLLDMVDPLLRCAAGEVGEPPDLVDLVSVTFDVIDKVTTSDAWGERRFSLQTTGSLPVRVDPSMIAVALGNLLRNAAMHSGDDHPVSISLFPMGDQAVVQVWDRGPGIPSDERERVFQRSVRGRSAGTTPGHGLGLFITRRIAEMYGGSLSLVDSPRGADFRFELPLSEGRRQPYAS